MGAMDGFYRAVYKETVLVWAITLWQTGIHVTQKLKLSHL
jgi:hypothetical protein